jgi:glycosyltransferase involved in cell wall biosynthesis
VTEKIIFGVSRATDYLRAIESVRSLINAGCDARVLITEPTAADFEHQVNGVTVDRIPGAPHDRPSEIWLSLIRYFEEAAPCVYITSEDYFASLVSSRLSNRVRIIGVLHSDTETNYDQLARLGQFWNAVVVRNPALRQRIIGEYPKFAARLAIIGDKPHDLLALIRKVNADVESGKFRREQKDIIAPPNLVPGYSVEEIGAEVFRVLAVPLWPDRIEPQRTSTHAVGRGSLRDHRIILSVPTGRVSGVDVFSVILARELNRRGYNAELVQTAPDAPVVDRLPMPADVPAGRIETRPYPTWPERWEAMKQYLEERAPCIYLPNYDNYYSCILPTLSPGVKVVGIGHSDDSQHYSHIHSLAQYWDAVVGVSSAITRSIATMAPGIESRQWTIPYGVEVPEELPPRPRRDTLRAFYAGRVVRYQKRATDLRYIAHKLRDMNVNAELTVAGAGTELEEFLENTRPVILSRHFRYLGPLSSEEVFEQMKMSDVFVLPSSYEGLPVSLLEAMAYGCVPVVSAIRSGVPEVISDGENGFIVPIGDIGAFCDRIRMLAEDEELLLRMRSRAHQTIRERYSLQRMVDSYIEVFESVISKPYERPTGPVKPPSELNRIELMIPRLPMPVRRTFWKIKDRFRR